jgi:alpha-L-rhamnosidase
MKSRILLSLLAFFSFAHCFGQTTIYDAVIENQKSPLALDVMIPRFSWKITANGKKNVKQTAYEIKVFAGQQSDKSNPVLWNSGKVNSSQSLYVLYGGPALTSAKRYSWQVRIWDNQGKASSWTASFSWQMGLLSPSDWKAQWISAGASVDTVNSPAPIFRRKFSLQKKILSAMAYVTSHGFYEASINGHKLGNAYLTPGWTSYNKRLQYQVYDVKDALQAGSNVIGVALGSGWYRSALGPGNPTTNHYGKDIALIFQMEITYTDGTKEMVMSDDKWKSSTGELRYAEIYNGAIIDARLAKKNWKEVSFNDQAWDQVKVQDYSKNVLVATYNEPVTKHEVLKPVKIITTPKGEKVIDFGQNLVGWVQLKVKGKQGDSIKLSHAEVLDKAGNFYTENLRAAKAENIYVLKGGAEESFEPQFTWQGFRYVKVEGIAAALNPADFLAVTIYSDMKPTGTFACSNPMINQLQKNILWGQKGNFLDVPTDCPQRDERLGWTGDAQVFSRTASFNMNVHNFFTKWMKDVAADQFASGSIPHVIPDIFSANGHDDQGGSAGWGDVATVVPWNMYLAYGDQRILETQYPSMKSWVDFMQHKSKNDLWNSGPHFGDWLFFTMDNDVFGNAAITNKFIIAQCFWAHSTQLLINTAKVLGKKEDEAQYTALLNKIKEAFLKEYVTPKGMISSDTQTAYTLALNFDMLPENLRQQAADRLADNIARYDNHLTTGFLGTPYLCHVLSRFGHADVAYKLLMQDTYPSWLYPVKMGATTIWERWDGIKPDGTLETPSMNSYNHYAYGAIGDWMYRVIAGIDTREEGVGYKEIIIKPVIGGGLTFANADYETCYGKVSSHWKITGQTLSLDVEIPANTSASIYIPSNGKTMLTESSKSITGRKDLESAGEIEGYKIVKVNSGTYHFATTIDGKL